MKQSNEHPTLFNAAEASSDALGDHPREGGPAPTLPLQPRQLRLEPIESAARIWIEKHYIHRDVPGLSLTFGVLSPHRELVGAIAFSEWVPFAPEGGRHHIWELRRLWLDDRCQKNSETRVIRVSLDMIRKLCPHVKRIVAYADLERHKGTIYKAAGFIFDAETIVNNSNSYGATKDIHRTVKRRYIKQLT